MTLTDSQPAQTPLTYPDLYHAADRASGQGQSLHIRLMGGQLGALLIAGVLSIWDSQATAIASAAAFAVAVLLWAMLQTMRPASKWFDGRAVAESIKSLTWKFAMRAPPFDAGTDDDAEARFRTEYHGILAEREDLGAQLVALNQRPVVVTNTMRARRQLSLDQRAHTYHDERLMDQLRWYSRKSRSNGIYGQVWLIVVLLCQIGGLTAATFRAAEIIEFDALSILSAFGGSAIAWMELKRHHEQERAYGVAALELSDIADAAETVKTELELSKTVLEGEGAVSREHKLWRAKRI